MERARLGKRRREGLLTVKPGCFQSVSQNQRRFKPERSALGSGGIKVGCTSESLGKLKDKTNSWPCCRPTWSQVMGLRLWIFAKAASQVILMLHLRPEALGNLWFSLPASGKWENELSWPGRTQPWVFTFQWLCLLTPLFPPTVAFRYHLDCVYIL